MKYNLKKCKKRVNYPFYHRRIQQNAKEKKICKKMQTRNY